MSNFKLVQREMNICTSFPIFWIYKLDNCIINIQILQLKPAGFVIVFVLHLLLHFSVTNKFTVAQFNRAFMIGLLMVNLVNLFSYLNLYNRKVINCKSLKLKLEVKKFWTETGGRFSISYSVWRLSVICTHKATHFILHVEGTLIWRGKAFMRHVVSKVLISHFLRTISQVSQFMT